MKLFATYIRQRRGSVLFFALLVVIFGFTFHLYNFPLAAVAYPAMLCMLLGGLWLAVGFIREKHRHGEIEKLCKMPAAMISELPAADGMTEEDYQRLVSVLRQKNRETELEMSDRYREMIDYYTVWVHQIKTPIASMRLNVQAEDTAFSRKIKNDLFRIEQYVGMVLAFLRLGAGNSDYVIREQDIDAILTRSIKRFAGEFIARKLTLSYRPLHLHAVTDEKWLAFVIEQVLSNALKYTIAGGISIYAEKETTLCIADTGIGIAPEDLPRIFEKGYTGYHGREQPAATGIGLYLCCSILKKLGHSISASSEVGKGTVIRIDLSQYQLNGE